MPTILNMSIGHLNDFLRSFSNSTLYTDMQLFRKETFQMRKKNAFIYTLMIKR